MDRWVDGRRRSSRKSPIRKQASGDREKEEEAEKEDGSSRRRQWSSSSLCLSCNHPPLMLAMLIELYRQDSNYSPTLLRGCPRGMRFFHQNEGTVVNNNEFYLRVRPWHSLHFPKDSFWVCQMQRNYYLWSNDTTKCSVCVQKKYTSHELRFSIWEFLLGKSLRGLPPLHPRCCSYYLSAEANDDDAAAVSLEWAKDLAAAEKKRRGGRKVPDIGNFCLSLVFFLLLPTLLLLLSIFYPYQLPSAMWLARLVSFAQYLLFLFFAQFK